MKKLLNKRNGIIAGILVVLLIVGVASCGKSAQVKGNKAVETAQAYVPETAEYVKIDEDERYIDVIFFDNANKVGYEVEVNKESGQVKKVEMQLADDLGSSIVKISEEDAKKILKEKYDGIKSSSAVLVEDNGMFEYEVSFKGDDFYGDADVNAENGNILDSVIKYGTVTTIPVSDKGENDIIGYEEAESLVISNAGGGTVRSIDLDKENQDYFYEVELHKDGMEKDYIVNAKTKEVMLESEHQCYFQDYHKDENQGNSQGSNQGNKVDKENLISAEEAKDIVFKKLPNGEIIEFHLDKDDGIYQYEGEARLNGYEYEFEINASSGVIIGWEKDRIDYDD